MLIFLICNTDADKPNLKYTNKTHSQDHCWSYLNEKAYDGFEVNGLICEEAAGLPCYILAILPWPFPIWSGNYTTMRALPVSVRRCP
jgi:hypothetical protein